MTSQTLSQELYIPKAFVFEAAMDLETATCHLKAMLSAASDRLANIGAGQDAGDMLEDTGIALSMIDAAGKYLADIAALNQRLYGHELKDRLVHAKY